MPVCWHRYKWLDFYEEERKQAGFAVPHSSLIIGLLGLGLGLGLVGEPFLK